MRPNPWLCIVLTPVAQALLLLTACANPVGTPTTRPLGILALVIPLGCYLWGLRGSVFVPEHPRRLVRVLGLGLVAAGLSFGGLFIGLQAITADAMAHGGWDGNCSAPTSAVSPAASPAPSPVTVSPADTSAPPR